MSMTNNKRINVFLFMAIPNVNFNVFLYSSHISMEKLLTVWWNYVTMVLAWKEKITRIAVIGLGGSSR